MKEVVRCGAVVLCIYTALVIVQMRPSRINVSAVQSGLPSQRPATLVAAEQRLAEHVPLSSPAQTPAPGSTYGLPTDWNVRRTSASFTEHAYVLVLSNGAFVDGALVMGASLRNVSAGLSSGLKQLCIVVTAGRLCNESLSRLVHTGFDVLVEVPPLAVHAPKAFFKDTFDKSYMFRLTCYKKIVFMDADMLAVRNPDDLFDKPGGLDEHSVGAIGFRDGKRGDYFQTGMMVVHPSKDVFTSIMEEFFSNVPPKGRRYNSGMSGRDGVLLRSIFGSRFKAIDNKYSRNLNPRFDIPEHVVCVHLRGKHKPWFDWTKPVADPELGKKEFGFTYLAWWSTYEGLHVRSAEYLTASAGHDVPGYGGKHAAKNVSPLTHVWMMRHTADEYVQLLSGVDRERRNRHTAGLVLVPGTAGQSCAAVCATADKKCSETEFWNTPIQDCVTLRKAFGCKRCELAVYWRPHPASDFPGVEKTRHGDVCRWNLMRDSRSRSTCGAFNESTRRLCPCL